VAARNVATTFADALVATPELSMAWSGFAWSPRQVAHDLDEAAQGEPHYHHGFAAQTRFIDMEQVEPGMHDQVLQRGHKLARSVLADDQKGTVDALFQVGIAQQSARFGFIDASRRISVHQQHARHLAWEHVVQRLRGERAQTVEVVVERVLVDLRPFRYFANGDLGVRFLGEDLPERLLHALDGGGAFLVFTRARHGFSSKLVNRNNTHHFY